jgi:hypothetical protein
VRTIPPWASKSIFSMDFGPSVVRMMSATACDRHRPPSPFNQAPVEPADRSRSKAQSQPNPPTPKFNYEMVNGRVRNHLSGGDVALLRLAASLPLGVLVCAQSER